MTADDPTPDELVARHRPLAVHLVRQVLARVPAHVDRHDLAAAADEALARAAQRYDSTRHRRFDAFAGAEVKRSLRDLLRSLPHLPPVPVEADVDEELRALEASINALPEQLRDAMAAYFERGLPADEETLVLVSAALGLLRDSLQHA